MSKLSVVAIAALAGLGTAATASAETITTTTTTVERVRPATKLTPRQRTVIYRTVKRERTVTPSPRVTTGTRVVEEPAAAPIVVGERIPPTVALQPVPESVYVAEPATPRYKYYYVNNQVVLVDPVTSEVVEVLDR